MPATPARKAAGRRTRSADVRGVLIDAAVTVLERDGVEALTVRAVAAEAGVAPMGVYNHLGGKDGLLIAVLARAFAGLRDAVTPDLTAPTGDQLRQSGHGYRRFALGHPVMYRLMFATPMGGPPGDEPAAMPPGAKEMSDVADQAFGALASLIERAQAAGEVTAGNPTAIAQQIWSAVHGAVSLELAGLSFVDDPAALYDDLIESLVRAFRPVT